MPCCTYSIDRQDDRHRWRAGQGDAAVSRSFPISSCAELQSLGVNPNVAGAKLFGAPVHKALAGIPEPVDMVDIFRNCGAAGSAVDEALALDPKPKVIWMQLIVINEEGPQGHACKALP